MYTMYQKEVREFNLRVCFELRLDLTVGPNVQVAWAHPVRQNGEL